MTIKMNRQIQAIIIATQAYKKWICAHKQATGTWSAQWDWHADTYKYYIGILTNNCELRSSIACFESVLSYPIEQTISTEMDDLGKFTFSF